MNISEKKKLSVGTCRFVTPIYSEIITECSFNPGLVIHVYDPSCHSRSVSAHSPIRHSRNE